MTTDKLVNRKPLVYGLIGLVMGVVATSFVVYTVKTEPLVPTSSTTASTGTATQSVNSASIAPTSTPSTLPSAPGMMARSDQQFIVMMIPHHESAVAMADLALSRAQHPEIKELARAIKTTQTQEIQQMKAWYKQWYGVDVPARSPGTGMGMMYRNGTSASQNPGMMNRGAIGGGWMGTDLEALKNASNFDQAFILQMIPHHQMAIMMSTMVANNAPHAEVRALAQAIIRSQSAEIQQMQQWYQTWYAQQK